VKQTGTTGLCAKGCTGLGIIPTNGEMRRSVPVTIFRDPSAYLDVCIRPNWSEA